METGHYTDRISFSEMVEKSRPLSFLGRRSFAPRPLSEATEIFDTDFEDDMSDEYSPGSLDSDSTLPSPKEIGTPPLTAGLGGYDFHFDETPVSGPSGPHLFSSSFDQKKNDMDELVIAMSPIEEAPRTPRQPFTALNNAVAELDESQVQDWTPRQVAQWMTDAGFETSVVEKFLIHDICGSVLLDMQFHDLKELDISSFGKRHRVMSHIQHLRNSSMFSAEGTLPRISSPAKTSRSQSLRRGRHTRKEDSPVVPEESVSIVAIEQLLPKPHTCSKGEDCPKWRKQQRKIQKLEEDFAADIKSIVVPSVVASSDVLGPSPAFTITRERLSEVQQRDPQENVRQFLSFQHVASPDNTSNPSPPPAPSAKIAQQLHDLPKLTIPTQRIDTDSPFRTPCSIFKHPSESQVKLRAQLQEDPYHYGGVASPVDVYRIGTPMSATDIPLTAFTIDPCERDVSQSVPPEMRYGATPLMIGETINRSQSANQGRRPRRPSFTPAIAPVRENSTTPPIINEKEMATHAGWMRKRKTTRLMRHEWEEHYFNLQGSKLDVQDRDAQNSNLLDSIDVDNYVLHAYSKASGSKLSAAFKKSIGAGTTVEPAFAFSLIPESQKNKKFFDKEKSHHFAVSSGKERVEWMRKLMLAKAMKKNDGQI